VPRKKERKRCGSRSPTQDVRDPGRRGLLLTLSASWGWQKAWYKGFCFSTRKTDPSSLFFGFDQATAQLTLNMFKLVSIHGII